MAISKLAALNPNTSRILHYAEALSRTQFNVLIRELSGDLRKSQPSASNAAAKVDKFIPQLFRLKVAGITFGALANDPVWAEGLQLGAQAALQREPDNKFDRRAVSHNEISIISLSQPSWYSDSSSAVFIAHHTYLLFQHCAGSCADRRSSGGVCCTRGPRCCRLRR